MKNLGLTVAIMLLSLSGFAQIKYWSGINSDQWNNAGNWNPVGIPMSTDSVEIGNGNNVVLTGAPAIVTKLRITANAKLTIDDANTSLNIFNSPNVGLHMNLSGDLVIADGVLAISDSQGSALVVEDRATIVNDGIISIRWFFAGYGLLLDHNDSIIQNNGSIFVGMSPGTNPDYCIKAQKGTINNTESALINVSWCEGSNVTPIEIVTGVYFDNLGEVNVSSYNCDVN